MLDPGSLAGVRSGRRRSNLARLVANPVVAQPLYLGMAKVRWPAWMLEGSGRFWNFSLMATEFCTR
jgi:hypothetical protein